MRVTSDASREAGRGHSVYDGQDRLGHIIHRSYGFVAVNRRGQPLGTFSAEREAVAAILAAAGAS